MLAAVLARLGPSEGPQVVRGDKTMYWSWRPVPFRTKKDSEKVR
ncbi:hypothetical protein [Nonomuraea sp. NPDC003709]